MRVGCSIPGPGDGDAALGGFAEDVERTRREIKVSRFTPSAAVGQRHYNRLGTATCSDGLATHRVVVRVLPIVSREVVEQQVTDCRNVLTVVVDDTTCAKASGIEGAITRLSTNHERGKIACGLGGRRLSS